MHRLRLRHHGEFAGQFTVQSPYLPETPIGDYLEVRPITQPATTGRMLTLPGSNTGAVLIIRFELVVLLSAYRGPLRCYMEMPHGGSAKRMIGKFRLNQRHNMVTRLRSYQDHHYYMIEVDSCPELLMWGFR